MHTCVSVGMCAHMCARENVHFIKTILGESLNMGLES